MIKKIIQFLIVLFLILVIGVILKNIYISFRNESNINKEVNALEEEANKFDRDNKNLNKLIKYFNSQKFQEKEIKNKLNLVKEGERVVVIQGGVSDGPENKLIEKDSRVTTKHANYYYWWKYFFGIRNNT